MDSFIGFDKTLPVDLNGTSNPDLLTEVTFGGHLEYPDGSVPMVVKTNTGRMSPVRGRTMKEYDQGRYTRDLYCVASYKMAEMKTRKQIGELKKENFNLKLRIYFLEERVHQKFGDEDVFKTNIELKVDVQSYKKELAEKQELLQHASETIDTLTSKYGDELEREIQSIRLDYDHRIADAEKRAEVSEKRQKDVENQLVHLEDDLRSLQTTLAECRDHEGHMLNQVQESKDGIAERDRRICDLTTEVQVGERLLAEVKATAEKTQDNLKDDLEKLRTNVGRRDRDIQRLSFIMKKKTSMDSNSLLEHSHLQDTVEDKTRSLEKLRKKLSDQEIAADKKDALIGKLEDLLRQKDEDKKAVMGKLKEAVQELATKKDQTTKMKCSIIQIMESLKAKTAEAKKLSDQIEDMHKELGRTKNELHLAKTEKQKESPGATNYLPGLAFGEDVDKLRGDNCELEERVLGLHAQFVDQEAQIERLVKSLGKKEGELVGFRDLLQKAEESLSQSETAVESLQRQLERERRANGSNEHLLQELDRLRGACAQLAREKGEYDAEIRELEKAVTARDDKLATANQMLLSAEETINVLERDARDQKAKDAASQSDVHELQQSLQEAVAGKESAILEKDRINLRLQAALDAKDRAQEEAFQQSPKTDDAKIQHLQLKLQEKDRLLQEVMEDASETSQRRDQDVRNLRQRLRDLDDEIQDLLSKHKKETGDLRRELDSQQSELTRKEHLYQVKLREFETLAQKIDITVGDVESPAIQQILLELQSLRGAVQSGDHNIRIEVNPGQSPPRHPGDREAGGKPPRPGVSHAQSRIPVRRTSSTSSVSDEPDHHGKQLTNLKAQNEALSKTLHATEETVRQQTQKMKYYKNMLVDNGLLPKCLSRSNSDPNLATWSPRSPRIGNGSKFRSTENLSRCVLSPQNGASVANQTDDIDKLLKENLKLRQQIDGYRRVLKVFQGRSLSPTTTDDSDNRTASDDEGPATGPDPISSESASCLLENWLDMMDKFLGELSQEDQNWSAHTGTSPTEVTRLRRGLVQARGAVHSLSKESLSGQDRVVSSTSGENVAAGVRTQTAGPQPSSTALYSPPPDYPAHSGMSPTFSTRTADTGDQSIEKPRHCSETPDKGPVRMFSEMSHFENSVFSNKSSHVVKHGENFTSEPLRVVRGQSNSSDGSNSDRMSDIYDSGSRPPNGHKNVYDQTFTQSFIARDPLAGIDQTMLQHNMFLELEDMSVDLDTESLRSRSQTPSIPNLENDKLRMKLQKLEYLNKTLKDELKVHEDLSNKGPKLDGDVMSQHLEELRQLRVRLERNLADSDNLQEQLTEELHKPTVPDPQLLNQEATIRDLQQLVQNLRNQLSTCSNSIFEKVTIIDEKERVIKETNIQLTKHRDNAARESSECDMYKKRLGELEVQLQESKSMCERFTNMVKQLKLGLEQFKSRVDQLEGDVKQHRDVANRYQGRANDLENELQQSLLMVDKYKLESDSFHERIGQLEVDLAQCRESEEQCRGMLGQSRLKVSELNEEITTIKERAEVQEGEICTMDSEVKRYKALVEDHTKQLHDKANLIQQQARELNDKSQLLNHKDAMYHDLNNKIENHTLSQSQLEAQLRQLKKLNGDQKSQIDKQNMIILEIERKLETAVKKKEKYLNNLKIVLKEMKKYRNELLLTQENLNEKTDVNKTLNLEISVHEKLNASRQGPCSEEDKENIILQLLTEVKQLRVQMERVIDRNVELRRSIEELLNRRQKDDSPARSQGTDATDGQPSPERPKPLGDRPGKLLGGPVEKETVIRKFTSEYEHRLNFLDSPDTTTSSDSGNIDEMDNNDRGLNIHGSDGSDGSINVGGYDRSFASSRGERSFGVSGGDGSFGANSTWPRQQDTTPTNAARKDTLSSSLPLGDSSPHFSIPGPLYKQNISDHCLLYNVHDSSHYLSGLTQVRIDADLRTLFAVGKIDHFETVKKEIGECQVILKGMCTRISERLATFTTKPAMESMEYSTLKELSMATENLRICLNEEASLIGCFWSSELPAPNEKGEFVNQKLLDEVAALKEQLAYMRANYKYMTTSVDAATDKLHSTNLQKFIDEDEICRSLESTTEVISLAKHNLQYNSQQQTTSPTTGKGT